MTFQFFKARSLSRAERRLEAFSTLRTGWHYGDGAAIDNDVILRAKQVVRLLLLQGFGRNNAFPSIDGDVKVSAYHGEHMIEVDVHTDNTFSMRHEIGDAVASETTNCSIEELRKNILRVAGEIWPSSDYSPTGIGMMSKTVSSTMPSRTLGTDPGSLLWTLAALRRRAA